MVEPGMSIERLQHLKDRARDLEDSNTRLREKVTAVKEGQAALDEENESLSQQIEALEAQLAAQQGKSQNRKMRSEETLVFVNRSGERWPRKPPIPLKGFVGIKYEKGSAVRAMKSILQQLFSSVVDAANFFSTSLQEVISAAELTRGLARLRIRHLETEHLLFDLDRRIVDGISIRGFIESFNWLETPIIVTPQSMAASRGRLSQVEQRLADFFNQNAAGFNADDYMKEKERSSTIPQNSFDSRNGGEGRGMCYQAASPLGMKQIGRALNVREKYLLAHNQIADCIVPDWIAELSAAYYGDSEPKTKEEGKTNRSALDESIEKAISCMSVDETRRTSSQPRAPRKSSTQRDGASQLTTQLVSPREHPSVRRLTMKHDKLLHGWRPVLSAVTADSTWVKQDRTLAAHATKKRDNDASVYDLDGRLIPKPPDETIQNRDSTRDSASKAERGRTKGGKFQQRKPPRDPFENASPANVAYMMIQKVSEKALASYDRTEDDKVFQHFLDDVIKQHPRAGTVAKQIALRRDTEGSVLEASTVQEETQHEAHTLLPPPPPEQPPPPPQHGGADDDIEDHHEHMDASHQEDHPGSPPLASREVSQEMDAHDDGGHSKPATPELPPEPANAEVSQEEVHREPAPEPAVREVSSEVLGFDVCEEGSAPPETSA